ncbi:MAG: hypothetical protein ABI330_03155, partial [Caldimonas sp.]
VMLGFWMGKDSKDHALGERGSTGGPGFAETGGRDWVNSAATVLAFLQKERGLLKPGYRFRPITHGRVLRDLEARSLTPPARESDPASAAHTIVEPSNPKDAGSDRAKRRVAG